jgi:hypothetical protein
MKKPFSLDTTKIIESKLHEWLLDRALKSWLFKWIRKSKMTTTTALKFSTMNPVHMGNKY